MISAPIADKLVPNFEIIVRFIASAFNFLYYEKRAMIQQYHCKTKYFNK